LSCAWNNVLFIQIGNGASCGHGTLIDERGGVRKASFIESGFIHLLMKVKKEEK
jgi:hypothetical protein